MFVAATDGLSIDFASNLSGQTPDNFDELLLIGDVLGSAMQQFIPAGLERTPHSLLTVELAVLGNRRVNRVFVIIEIDNT